MEINTCIKPLNRGWNISDVYYMYILWNGLTNCKECILCQESLQIYQKNQCYMRFTTWYAVSEALLCWEILLNLQNDPRKCHYERLTIWYAVSEACPVRLIVSEML